MQATVLVKSFELLVELCKQKIIFDFNHVSEKNDATATDKIIIVTLNQ